MSSAKNLGDRSGQRGQVIVLAALAMVAFISVVALIIDGGNAYAQQRGTQNGTDAASEAGAVVLMQKLVGVAYSDISSGATSYDDAVRMAVMGVATQNNLDVSTLQACYTDLTGTPLSPSGNQVADCSAGAAQVGGGTIPPCLNPLNPCPGSGNASGVRVYGSRSFRTFISNIVGISSLTASATATAIAGYVQAYPGAVLPVTFPFWAGGCDNSGSSQPLVPTQDWRTGASYVYALPLCKDGSGSVGWLDWDPPAGGASQLAGAILNSTNPPITTPKWYHVVANGTLGSSAITGVQASMDYWAGKVVMLPIFGHTCGLGPNTQPTGWSVSQETGAVEDCTSAGGTLEAGSGANLWYYLVGFAQFHLIQSFVNGGDGGACSFYYGPWTVPMGNINSCLIGYFTGQSGAAVDVGYSVGGGGGTSLENSTPGVQLIR